MQERNIFDAVKDGNPEEVKHFLDRGTDINIRGNTTRTPLILAAYEGQKEIVRLLIERRADVNAFTVDEYSNSPTALHEAAQKGHFEIAELLIKSGSDVNFLHQSNLRALPALHLASASGHTNIVKLLLDHGANINAAAGVFRWTALHFAADIGRTDTALELIRRGANIYAQDLYNRRPLAIASMSRSPKIATALLNCGIPLPKDDAKTVQKTLGVSMVKDPRNPKMFCSKDFSEDYLARQHQRSAAYTFVGLLTIKNKTGRVPSKEAMPRDLTKKIAKIIFDRQNTDRFIPLVPKQNSSQKSKGCAIQ